MNPPLPLRPNRPLQRKKNGPYVAQYLVPSHSQREEGEGGREIKQVSGRPKQPIRAI